jgi:hypothetical protein
MGGWISGFHSDEYNEWMNGLRFEDHMAAMMKNSSVTLLKY